MHIKTLELDSSNLEAQQKFYVQQLGFTQNHYSEDSISVQAGRTELKFNKSSEQPYYHYCFLVPTNKLDDALAWVKERTEVIKIDGEYTVESNTEWNAKSIYFYDGNNNIIELIAHFNLDNSSDKKFSAQSVISVNEIGCPSADIHVLNQWFEKEEGCFLLVNNEVKDTWFPTDRFPESADFSAIISFEKKEYEMAFKGGKFSLI